MKFWNLDRHVAVIEDLKFIFRSLGHSVDSVLQSKHAWVVGSKPVDIPELRKEKLPNLIKNNSWRWFADKYGKALDGYDAFIVTYPPAYALLLKDLGKPIVMQVPIRYEYPFSLDRKSWEFFNAILVDLHKAGMLLLSANSLFDKVYTEMYLGIPCRYIPSICAYRKTRPCTRDICAGWWRKSIKHIAGVAHANSLLGPRFVWDDLAACKAILHVPYNVSIMSFFEHYSASIPIFAPSKSLLPKLPGAFSEASWTNAGHSYLPPAMHTDMPDPNDRQNCLREPWIQLSDFYNRMEFPFVQYFDSTKELHARLEDRRALLDLRKEMIYHSRRRLVDVTQQWKEAFSELFTH